MFADRADAGRRLAALLAARVGGDAIVLGLPRGGVVVAFEIAQRLHMPLDVIVVRKLGVPRQPELAMGALGEGGVRVLDEAVIRAANVGARDIEAVATVEAEVLAARAGRFRAGRRAPDLRGREVVIVDDGLATGSTARAACAVARAAGAARVVLAVPVAPSGTVRALRSIADDVVVVATPSPFAAIGQFYDDFTQTPDDEVVRLLDRAQTG
jgi:putative phosphoribosyl transferase